MGWSQDKKRRIHDIVQCLTISQGISLNLCRKLQKYSQILNLVPFLTQYLDGVGARPEFAEKSPLVDVVGAKGIPDPPP